MPLSLLIRSLAASSSLISGRLVLEGHRGVVARPGDHPRAARGVLELHPQVVERAVRLEVGGLERQHVGDAGAAQHLPHGGREVVVVLEQLAAGALGHVEQRFAAVRPAGTLLAAGAQAADVHRLDHAVGAAERLEHLLDGVQRVAAAEPVVRAGGVGGGDDPPLVAGVEADTLRRPPRSPDRCSTCRRPARRRTPRRGRPRTCAPRPPPSGGRGRRTSGSGASTCCSWALRSACSALAAKAASVSMRASSVFARTSLRVADALNCGWLKLAHQGLGIDQLQRVGRAVGQLRRPQGVDGGGDLPAVGGEAENQVAAPAACCRWRPTPGRSDGGCRPPSGPLPEP